MLNEAGGPLLPERPRFRFCPAPAAIFPWVWPVLVFLYALPRAGHVLSPGQLLREHYPTVVEGAKAVLAAYWSVAAIYYLYRLARAPRETYGRVLQLLLAALLLGCGVSYGLVRLKNPAVDNIALPGALLCGVLAFLIALPVSGRLPRSPVVALIASLVVVLPLGYVGADSLWPGWRDMASVRGPEHHIYHVQRYAVLQGRVLALTEEVSRGPLYLRTRVIGAVGDDSWSRVVLARPPVPLPRSVGFRGELVLTPDARWLLYLRQTDFDPPGSCEVAFAYDRRTSHLHSAGDLATAFGAKEAPDWAEVVKALDNASP